MRNTGLLFFGGLLILIGLASLVESVFSINLWAFFWPSLLIVLGLWLLVRPRWPRLSRGVDVNFIGDVQRSGAWKADSEEIWLFIGDVKLDFVHAELPVGETFYRINGFIGDVDVFVTQEIGVSVLSNGFVSGTHLFGEKHDRFLLPFEWKSPNYETAERKLCLETVFFINDLNVKRV